MVCFHGSKSFVEKAFAGNYNSSLASVYEFIILGVFSTPRSYLKSFTCGARKMRAGLKLCTAIPCVPTESRTWNQPAETRKGTMQKSKFYRSLLAISTIAMFWSAPALMRATELHPLVVTGIALDKVATFHPAPAYPRVAMAFGIDGKVQIEVKVQKGRITEASALSGPPMLASSAKAWIVGNWKFKPEISGVFTIPISYKRQA